MTATNSSKGKGKGKGPHRINPYNNVVKERFEILANLYQQRRKTSTVINEYKKFMNWVEENGHRPPTQLHFITRETVDAYFREQVVYRVGGRNTIQRIVSTLQHY